ncbi:polysaccharide biosynthesis protein [Ramlibacter henchirensis]|uniref:Polysaccharide biosynthesis protein n=1 Tax=Ramlibacter henchirensis TaxID=204072 RepID=A0A4Z0BWM3_9BURK|nr:nucleoside-diphosphate sugar epimerase/dehydratase [Ramlibacter henchirensis]TFZ02435.1 polysaccharide biosynthesis protein [Ramlibacter henchirensis]
MQWPRRAARVTLDLALVALAWWLAFWLRFNLEVPGEFIGLASEGLGICVVAYAAAFVVARVWRHVWSYTGLPELRQLVVGIVVGGAITGALLLALRLPNFPRSVLLLQPVLALVLLGAARAGWRTVVESRSAHGGGRRVLIVGSLQDAADALRALKGSHEWLPVGIVSPIPSDVGRSIQDVRVLGGVDAMAQACAEVQAQTALVASPPGSDDRRQALLGATDAGIPLLTLPRPDEWLKAQGAGPRRVELEDLLGREPVQLDEAGLSDLMSGQTVLVTGAGGSIGSELCRQIARFGAARLVCLDISEYAIYELEQELRASHPQMRGLYYTCNVREPQRLAAIAQRHRPAVVFHAAAYKHVPLMEQLNEIEALRTNVIGTLNAARVAGECGARRFVMISTDKAVNPTNVMGASKRLAEMLVQAVAGRYPQTRFVSVRFGNVLGSSGSVVPLFASQIARGGPVTVTHPEIVRYFMTIPEAAQLVLQAGLMGQSGEIFVLDMGEPVRIVELARMLIRLSGHSEQEIPISYIGLRPGEKLYEELLANDETTVPTPHPKLRVAKSGGALPDIEAVAKWIEGAGAAPAGELLRGWLREQVPEYSPPGTVDQAA